MSIFFMMAWGWIKVACHNFWQVLCATLVLACVWLWHGKDRAEKISAEWRNGFNAEQVAFRAEQVNFQSCQSSILSQNASISLLNRQSDDLLKSTKMNLKTVIEKDAFSEFAGRKISAQAEDGGISCKTPESVMGARSSL